MPQKWPKVINDPIHDLVLFEQTDCDRLLLRLINTTEFQRLRRIKQLGMSELVFPGASHTRFAHSIGVMQMARNILARLQKLSGNPVSDEIKMVVLAAALLHDLGHGPFSHTFEKVTAEDHEARTEEVILDDATEVNKCLREVDESLPQKLIGFFGISEDTTSSQMQIPKFFTHVVSSQLDADRFDYLLRDSYATKTQYGIFEYKWLIEHLHFDPDHDRLYLSGKAMQAVEGYVYARYHMYRAVYFHKTTRSAEVMLRLLFKRFKELHGDLTPSRFKKVVPFIPPSVFQAFTQQMNLQQYLALDDHAVSEFMKACEKSSDPLLKNLGAGLLHRRLYKATDATVYHGGDVGEFVSNAKELVAQRGLDVAYSFVDDGPADTPYKPYDPDEGVPAKQIYVENSLGDPKEISTLSSTVDQLKKKYTLLRYYYPEDLREEIDAMAKSKLRRLT